MTRWMTCARAGFRARRCWCPDRARLRRDLTPNFHPVASEAHDPDPGQAYRYLFGHPAEIRLRAYPRDMAGIAIERHDLRLQPVLVCRLREAPNPQ